MKSSGPPLSSASVLAGAGILLLPVSGLMAAPAGPTPQIPAGGGAPGPYPNTSVSAVNVLAKGGTTYDGTVNVTGLEGSGPIPWSVNRYNRGDFAMRLSPANPAAALGNLNKGAFDFSDASPGLAASQAWRPARELGVTLPTARQNGPITWQDGEAGFYPTTGTAWASSGPGYSMLTGAFANGDLDINTGRAAFSGGHEGNFSFSVSWFPYDQGWLGGAVDNPVSGDPALPENSARWISADSHAAGLSPGLVTWVEYPQGSGAFGGVAQIRLPGVNSLTDGMIFTTSADGASDVNITNVLPFSNGEGWALAIREDAVADSAEVASGSGQSEFQFLYVPYNAVRLIGGAVSGAGAKKTTRGDFTVTRTATGTYSITISGKTAASGTLLLQAAGADAADTELPSRAIISYEYTGGAFVVKTAQVTGEAAAENVDSDFYFAWVDFAAPMAMPDAPRLRARGPVTVNAPDLGIDAKEANLAVNPGAAEVLVTTVDSTNALGAVDPGTGGIAASALLGRFYNPVTMEPLGELFPIITNPAGEIVRHDVKYNPVSNRYVVVANTRGRGTSGANVVTLALVKPSAVAGENPPAETQVVHDEGTTFNYDDVSVAVSTVNGNILLAAERAFTGEGEGVVAVLFDKDLAPLTTGTQRLDKLQAQGDEDDPDVIYLPSKDAFLYIANTDNSNGSTGTLATRVVVSVVQTTPGAGGALVSTTEQPIGDGNPAVESHPSAIENPFNDQLLSVWDSGDNSTSGDLAYTSLGAGPGYTFTPARAEVPYLRAAGAAGNPYVHRHPQLAADPDSGVIALGHFAQGSTVGLPPAFAYRLLDSAGLPFAGQTHEDFLADIPGGTDNGPNYSNIKYSPASRSFLAVFNGLNNGLGGVTLLSSLAVTSNHLPTATEPPVISISSSGADVVVSWNVSGAAFTLEASDDLSTGWAAVGTAPVRDGGFDRVTIPRDRVRRFFRLTAP